MLKKERKEIIVISESVKCYMQRFDTFTFIFSVYYCNTQLLGNTQQGAPSHYCHPRKTGTNTKIK